MAVTVEQLKTLFPLTIENESITPHLNRAEMDYKHIDFKDDDTLELEVVGSKTLYYLAPLLWVDMQDRADEYGESLQTFKDVEKFKANWLDRANSALNNTNNDDQGEASWDVI